MKYLYILFLLFPCWKLFAQSLEDALKVGDMIPDVILNRPQSDNDTITSIYDYKGKLIILDFWNTSCGSCIASLPKMEKLQQQFPDKLSVMLIDNSEGWEKIDTLFKKKGWRFPDLLAFTQIPVLDNLFPHFVFPHHVWINPDGTVMAITDDKYATSANVQRVLNKEKLNMRDKNDIKFNTKKPLLELTKDINGTSPLYYSAITNMINSNSSGIANWEGNRLYYNMDVVHLFMEAFDLPLLTGANYVIFDLSDSLRNSLLGPERGKSIESLNTYSRWQKENTYCYNLFISDPNLTVDKKKVMQKDLNVFFASSMRITANKEKHEAQCLVISLNENQEFYTSKYSKAEDNSKNQNILRANLELLLKDLKMPIVIEGKIRGDIGADLADSITNIKNARIFLKKYGLDLEKEVKTIDMLIFREIKAEQ